MKLNYKKIKYDSNGLFAAIIQDYKTNEVLMLGYMNKESLIKTLATGKVTYYSRSRKKIWVKGETSGNFQIVKSMAFDCDMDALLIKAHQIGDAACHTGYRSCFFQSITKDKQIKYKGKKVFDPKDVYKN